MKWLRVLAGFLALLAVAAGCGPVVSISNNTTIGVRVVVTAAGHSDVVSPSPGNGSSVEAEEGPYHVTVIPDAEWAAHAHATRDFLDQQLAQSDALTGPQLLELIKRLKDTAATLHQYETAGLGARCGGTITQDGGGTVSISAGADGTLVAVCK